MDKLQLTCRERDFYTAIVNSNLQTELIYSPDSFIKKWVAPLVPYPAMVLGILILNNAWAAILIYHASMVLVLAFSTTGITVKSFFYSKSALLPVITALGGILGGLLLRYLWPYLSIPADLANYLAVMGLTETTWPWFLAYFILVNAALEEYYWRGFLGSKSILPILNDFWYSGYHVIVLAGKINWEWLAAIFVVLAGAAWLWRQMNHWSRGMLPSLIFHFTADASIMLTVFILASG
jgi:hypothetical protein